MFTELNYAELELIDGGVNWWWVGTGAVSVVWGGINVYAGNKVKGVAKIYSGVVTIAAGIMDD